MMKHKKWLLPLIFFALSAASLYVVLTFFGKWIYCWCILVLPIFNVCYTHFYLDNWRKDWFFILYNGILVYLPVVVFLIILAIKSDIGDLFLVGCIGFVWCLLWGCIGMIGKKSDKQSDFTLPPEIIIPKDNN